MILDFGQQACAVMLLGFGSCKVFDIFKFVGGTVTDS